MAFVHSMATRVLINGLAASASLSSIEASNSRAMSDSTCFPDKGQRWRPGLVTGTLSLHEAFGDEALLTELVDANGVDDAVTVTAGLAGFGLGAPVFTAVGDLTTHGTSSTVSEVVGLAVETTSDERTWMGVSLHDLAAETGTGEGGAVDHGSATTSGAVVVTHLTELAGTTPTAEVVVQHSADDATYVDLVTLTATTTGVQRQVVAGTVQRYVRAVWTLGETTTSATFTVALAR